MIKKILIFTFFIAFFGIFITTKDAQALSGADFQPGRIIDDSVFFSSGNISPNDIQNFLNAKVPVCDTNGTQPYAGTTRAAYSTTRGYPPPFICLRNYSQDTPNKDPEPGLCGIYSGGEKTAAQIIYDIGVSCSINPRALIVLLEKEQSLITDDWPWSIQYRSATGFGCPDTAPCDIQYYGFFNQVFNAARQFKRYQRDANIFSYRSNRDNYIQYNPNSACGGSNVFIQNQATAGLYNYTPYQPNSAALSNIFGSGDACSAYGNRNFWRLFNEWFGAVNGPPYFWQVDSQEAYSDALRTKPFTSTVTAQPGTKIFMRIKARNQGFLSWNQSTTYLGTSSPKDRTSPFYDSSWIGASRVTRLIETTVAPGQVGTFEFILNSPSSTGGHRESFNIVQEGITWLNDIGLYYEINVVSPTTPIGSIDPTLQSGHEIKQNEYLMSQDAQSKLVILNNGDLEVQTNFSNLVWSANTYGSGATKLVMQSDGNLVLYNQSGSPLWHTNTYGNPGARLVLQTDGNLVIYTATNVPIWANDKLHNPDHLAYVNTILYTDELLPLQRLETADRNHKLVVQPDGNLVLYNGSGQALWHTGTFGKGPAKLVVQPDGNLVLYNGSGQALWHTNTFGR